jgi:hypothetical protein
VRAVPADDGVRADFVTKGGTHNRPSQEAVEIFSLPVAGELTEQFDTIYQH